MKQRMEKERDKMRKIFFYLFLLTFFISPMGQVRAHWKTPILMLK
jgi:hypothetical protein